MNFLKKNQNKMRFCSLLIWKRLFLKKEILSEILMDEMYFISLNEKDKSFVYYIINVVLRNSVQIEFFYKRFLKKKINDDLVDLKGILSLGTAEIFWSRTPNYAIVDSYVDLTKDKFGKKKAGFVNAILLNLIRNKEKISSLNWNVRNNFPRALLKNWEIYYGKKLTNDIVNTISSNPYLDLICSKKMPKTYKKKLIQYLEGKEIYPNVIRSIYKGRISNIQGFLEGNWWIQDIGSYIHLEILINKLIRDKNFKKIENLSFYDVCAAPGGKTFQLLDNGFKVVSNDINKKRIQILLENLERLNFKTKICCNDALKLNFEKKFNVIIIDAPCTSTGTIRKNPDILIHKSLNNIKKTSYLQKKLLSKASTQLEENGYIMYIVCSLEKKEGEDIINAFLKKNKNFCLIPITKDDCSLLNKHQITKEGYIRLLPNLIKVSKIAQYNGNNGFFSAILKKDFKR